MARFILRPQDKNILNHLTSSSVIRQTTAQLNNNVMNPILKHKQYSQYGINKKYYSHCQTQPNIWNSFQLRRTFETFKTKPDLRVSPTYKWYSVINIMFYDYGRLWMIETVRYVTRRCALRTRQVYLIMFYDVIYSSPSPLPWPSFNMIYDDILISQVV